VVFNRIRQPRFDARAVARVARRVPAAISEADVLTSLAQSEIRRAADERRALRLVRRRIPSPIIALAERRGTAGPELIRELATRLLDGHDIVIRPAQAARG
jgi:hypothetical protein